MRIAKDGLSLILTAAIAAAVLIILAGALESWLLGVLHGLAVVFLGFSLYFFRDPQRDTPTLKGAVIAPADGKIIEISDPYDVDEVSLRKISIFMSPLNVHVNRIPISGTIEKLNYNKGKYLTAFHEKASLLNEQQFIRIKTDWGSLNCVQIAGWLARRIVCHLHEGQQVRTGERFGLIKFGSRLDLHLPVACRLQIVMDQIVRGGETVIGVFDAKN
ncbi:MAG: phosphatidylserine decarboxylase family protein [bacterium]|nr:phosphatidylserine decarboxylase family protein [bacterium]